MIRPGIEHVIELVNTVRTPKNFGEVVNIVVIDHASLRAASKYFHIRFSSFQLIQGLYSNFKSFLDMHADFGKTVLAFS